MSNASINVVRDHSTSDTTGVYTGTEQGSFTLFNILQEDGSIRPETLNLQIICDNSVIEIFANGRFALSTRAYPTRGDAVGLSVKLSGENGKELEAAVIRSCDVRMARGGIAEGMVL
jgi:beta-fructofuranosidase